MNILIVSATPFEVAPLVNWLDERFESPKTSHYTHGELAVDVLYSGVGLPVTAFALGTVLAGRNYDLAIQAGIGGAIDAELAIGTVVEIISERFGDLGAETADEGFLDLQTLGLLERESGIFTGTGQLLNPGARDNPTALSKCNGISMNRVTGSTKSVEQLRQRYPEAQVESMEGAAFFYACLHHQLAFLQLRAISNRVEARDRESWDIPLAIKELNAVLVKLVEAFWGD